MLKIEEPVPHCDERVITIVGDNKETEEDIEQGNEVNNEADTDSKEKDDEMKDDADNINEDKDSVPIDDLKNEKDNLSILKALSLVFERMVDGIEETAKGNKESNCSSDVVFRLLALSSQVGCLLGKSGSVIKQTSADSRAQIRILPKDNLPVCASASDDLVQITGDLDAVRKAFQSISKQLLENRPRDHECVSGNSAGCHLIHLVKFCHTTTALLLDLMIFLLLHLFPNFMKVTSVVA